MRLEIIQKKQAQYSNQIQSLPHLTPNEATPNPPKIASYDPPRRVVVRTIAGSVLRSLQTYNKRQIKCKIPFHTNLIGIGERFCADASRHKLQKLTQNEKIRKVLILGAPTLSEDAQYWLRRNIDLLAAIDVFPETDYWDSMKPKILKQFNVDIIFRQATAESIPFEDGFFDLIVSQAVLEHVRNLSACFKEIYRLLRPGGWSWHAFGPLYYCYGGDHCISDYGMAHGYDHLLLSEEAYQDRIQDQAFYSQKPDPNCRFWALHDQFSFATPSEYLSLLSKCLEIVHVVTKISDESMAFRAHFPEKWDKLLSSGILESDLMTKGLAVISRKPSSEPDQSYNV